MTDSELSVERDWLLERGYSLEHVNRREQLLKDALTIAKFALFAIRLSPGERCPCCRRIGEYRNGGHNSRCDLLLAAQRISGEDY